MVFDVDEDEFLEKVVERSREVPVVVDFWAEWCGPCRALGPALERAAAARDGKVDLAKVDVDRNQSLAATFGIQGIPAVKAFRNGQVVNEFTGALPPPQVEAFFDSLVPSESDELVERGDEESLRRALELDPRNASAAAGLARLMLQRGETDEAIELLQSFEGDFLASGLLARAQLTAGGNAPPGAFEAWDAGDYEEALNRLQEAFAEADDPEERDLLRRVMVAIFTELGADNDLAREHRRRLSAALY